MVFKRSMLSIRKIWWYCTKRIVKWVGYAILIMCVALFCSVLAMNITHRIPIVSFWNEEIGLPQKCKLNSIVNVYSNNNEIKTSVSVSIGGFEIEGISGEQIELMFVTQSLNNIPVIISYDYDDEKIEEIDYLSLGDKYEITHVFSINVGE